MVATIVMVGKKTELFPAQRYVQLSEEKKWKTKKG